VHNKVIEEVKLCGLESLANFFSLYRRVEKIETETYDGEDVLVTEETQGTDGIDESLGQRWSDDLAGRCASETGMCLWEDEKEQDTGYCAEHGEEPLHPSPTLFVGNVLCEYSSDDGGDGGSE
jgi:hypothetical protein